jgi:hypothetical protein
MEYSKINTLPNGSIQAATFILMSLFSISFNISYPIYLPGSINEMKQQHGELPDFPPLLEGDRY